MPAYLHCIVDIASSHTRVSFADKHTLQYHGRHTLQRWAHTAINVTIFLDLYPLHLVCQMNVLCLTCGSLRAGIVVRYTCVASGCAGQRSGVFLGLLVRICDWLCTAGGLPLDRPTLLHHPSNPSLSHLLDLSTQSPVTKIIYHLSTRSPVIKLIPVNHQHYHPIPNHPTYNLAPCHL